MRRTMALALIEIECVKACKKFPKFNSTHEGYAVIKEELDELWGCIKVNKNPYKLDFTSKEKIRKEAIQTGAMVVRFLMDIIHDEGEI